MALTKDRDSLKEKLFVSEQNLSTANDKVIINKRIYNHKSKTTICGFKF